jgi:dCMP deaminase
MVLLKKNCKCDSKTDVSIKNKDKDIEDKLVKAQIKSTKRPAWDEYFMNIAKDVSLRSTCLSTHYGAVVTKNNQIMSTGYNGAPHGTKDCYQRGYCIRRKLNVPSGERYELCASVHAEQNAIINAAKQNLDISGGTLYLYGIMVYKGVKQEIDSFPCFICKKMIINASLEKIVCSTKKGTFMSFAVSDWIKEWQTNDIILVNDKNKYHTEYL